jgi:hypothetical protein
MPPSENGASELVKKILGRKDKTREEKEPEEPTAIVEVPEPVKVMAQPKQSRFAPIDNDTRIDEVPDLGNLTAAELRQSTMGEFLNIRQHGAGFKVRFQFQLAFAKTSVVVPNGASQFHNGPTWVNNLCLHTTKSYHITSSTHGRRTQ